MMWCGLTWCLRCRILVTDAMASFFSFSHLNKVVLKVRSVLVVFILDLDKNSVGGFNKIKPVNLTWT